MSTATLGPPPVAKKKTETEGEPKRYGTLIRVSDDFANAIKNASSFEKMSVAEFATAYLLPLVEKRYRDAVMKEAKKLTGEK